MTFEITALTRDILARAGRPIPRFGDRDWHALPEGDLRRVAAVLIAAEAWREHCSAARVAADLQQRLVEDSELATTCMLRAAGDIYAALPIIESNPWWVRLAEAERAAKADARRHFDEFIAHNRPPT